MIELRFRERERFAHIARIPLAERIVPTFHMIGLTFCLANTVMGLLRKDPLIGVPKIAETLARLVGIWNLCPQLAASCFAAVTDDKGNNLARAAAECSPQPAFIGSFQDKGPNFIDLQRVVGLCGHQRIDQTRQSRAFFSTTGRASAA